MSGIDGRNLPANTPTIPIAQTTNDPLDPNNAQLSAAGDDGEAFNPFAPPGSTGKHAKGAARAGGAAAGAGAGAAQGAGAAAGPEDAAGLQGMPANFDQDSGVIGEKKRTGLAALSDPPPMPPSAIRMTPDHLQNFTTLNSDMHEALSRGAATNQPNFQDMSKQLAATNTNTAQGQAQAQQLQGRMTQVANTHVASLAGASGIGAFLLLAVGYQDKQKNTMGQLSNLTMQAREQTGKMQVAQQQEQARAMEKAQKKQDAMSFLKPLLAVVMAAFSVLTMGTGTGLALAAMGAMAGFIGGGVMGGKQNGGGFDVGKAFEGAAMGMGAGGLGGMLTKMATMAAETAAKAGINIGGKAALQAGEKEGGKTVARWFSDQLQKAGVKESASGSKELAKTGEKAAAQAGKTEAEKATAKAAEQKATTDASKAGAKNSQDAVKKGEEGAAAAPTGIVNKSKNYLSSKLDDFKKQPLEARMQAASNIGQFATDTTAATGQFMVDNERAKASTHEARAKMIKVIEQALQQEGDRTQDSIQALVDHRKQTFDTIASVENSSNQAASKIATNIASH